MERCSIDSLVAREFGGMAAQRGRIRWQREVSTGNIGTNESGGCGEGESDPVSD